MTYPGELSRKRPPNAKKRKLISYACSAVGLLIVAGITAFCISQEQEAAVRASTHTTLVFALKDIAEGTSITAESLEERDILECHKPPNGFPHVQAVAGQTASKMIHKGTFVQAADIAQ